MNTKTNLIGLMVLIPENNDPNTYEDYIGINLSTNDDEYEEN